MGLLGANQSARAPVGPNQSEAQTSGKTYFRKRHEICRLYSNLYSNRWSIIENNHSIRLQLFLIFQFLINFQMTRMIEEEQLGMFKGHYINARRKTPFLSLAKNKFKKMSSPSPPPSPASTSSSGSDSSDSEESFAPEIERLPDFSPNLSEIKSLPEEESANIEINVDSIITRLLKSRGGKAVDLSLDEIRGLCQTVRSNFVVLASYFYVLVSRGFA